MKIILQIFNTKTGEAKYLTHNSLERAMNRIKKELQKNNYLVAQARNRKEGNKK